MLISRNLETLLESSCEQTKERTHHIIQRPIRRLRCLPFMIRSHRAPIGSFTWRTKTLHNSRMTLFNCRYIGHEAKELCSNSSSSLSANKVNSQLVCQLEQAVTSRLLSSASWLGEFVVYKTRWVSIACFPFVRSFMGQWLAQLDR